MNEITLTKPSELQVVNASPEQAAQSFIQMAMERNTPVGEMTELVKVWKELVTEGKRAAFAKALTNFQANVPQIPRGHKSPFKRVNAAGIEVPGRYSDLGDIAKAITPALRANGLSFEWDAIETVERCGQIFYRACVVIRHESGYSERKIGGEIPLGKPIINSAGKEVQSAAQVAAGAIMTAQRLSLKSAFGLWSIDADEEDAAIEADKTETITEQQADELIALLAEYNEHKGDKVTAGLEKAMLAAVGVVSIQAIPAAKFDEVARKLVGHVATAKAGAK